MCTKVSSASPGIGAFLEKIDRMLVRLVLRFQWKRSRELVESRIRTFEATEDDSSWQLLHATTQISDGKTKAGLFLQAMEEAHHAEVFRALFEESSGKKLKKISVPRKPIFRGEAWKLFAYCAVGEASAARRFQHIAHGLPEGKFKASLEKILKEEEGHVALAKDLVGVTGRSEREVKREISRIKVTRAWESWLRVGRGVTNFVSRALLHLTYFAIGWWLKPKETP